MIEALSHKVPSTLQLSFNCAEYSEALLAGPPREQPKPSCKDLPASPLPLTSPQLLPTKEAEQAPTFLPRIFPQLSTLGQGTVTTKGLPMSFSRPASRQISKDSREVQERE